MKKRLNEIMSNATGQDIEKIKLDTDRDYIMEAAEAVTYGLVDKIVENA